MPQCSVRNCTDTTNYGFKKLLGKWWCSRHAIPVEQQLRKQADELDWYDGNIRLREQALRRNEQNRESEAAIALRLNTRRDDPRVKREMAAQNQRTGSLRYELETLKRNRATAAQRHEHDNGRRFG
ncbi:MAG TPA: hypothetical protein VHE33_10050 [Acidobacteriaceae bacterium]|nr:hypothetical protein [Acidobacteriaceae bacterium]